MNKKYYSLILAFFLLPLVSNAATVTITNDSFTGGGALSSPSATGTNTASNSHSGILGEFDDFWTVTLVPSSDTFSIVSSIPQFTEFNVEYSLDNGATWIQYVAAGASSVVETVTASIVNVSAFKLHVFGNAANPNGLAGTYQMTVNSVSAVPVPAAVWLFGSALMGLVGFSKRKSSKVAA